jgi:hypothetical protein
MEGVYWGYEVHLCSGCHKRLAGTIFALCFAVGE